MTAQAPRSSRRHAPLMLVLALAACGGGSATTGDVAVVSGASAVVPTPSPAPSPTPTPTGTVGTASAGATLAAPSLAGLDPVASGVDVKQFLGPAWGTGALPGLEPGQTDGAFRFTCTPTRNAYDDPIVYPGQPGKSHLHTFFGNTAADANSTYTSLRTRGNSSCANMLNRSAYWIPAMMNGAGKVVMPDYVAIYYKSPPNTAGVCTFGPVKACIPLPRGLRYIFGYNMLDPSKSDPAGARYWNCDGPGAVPAHYATITDAVAGCPAGARLGAVLQAPPCWNGKDLDSPDHRSHMAYPSEDGFGHNICPATHPYIIPAFQIGIWYTNDGTAQKWFLSSDHMAGMADAVPGSTLHADWFGAWEDSVSNIWFQNCISKMLSCSGAELGDGQQMLNLFGRDPGYGTTLVDPPAKPT